MALDAVQHVRLLKTGYRGMVHADPSNYCGEIPHSELPASVARRVSHLLLGWIEVSLEVPVEDDHR